MNKTEAYDNENLFKKLKQRPKVAWPTVILMSTCLSTIAAVWYFCLTGKLSLVLGCILNSIAMYYLFSPIHDSMHQAVFKTSRYNKISLAMCVLPILPLSTGQFLRMMHMQHHRFANDELDPDHKVARNWKYAFSLWMVWGFIYSRFYQKNKKSLPKLSKKLYFYDSFILLFVVIPLIFIIPLEMIFLWLIPTLVMSWLICAVFMFLPHYPHRIKYKDDPYKSTVIREGHEWFVTPLLANQNYHLVHHLYPTVPFYLYQKVWNAKHTYHNSFNPAKVSAFRLTPS